MPRWSCLAAPTQPGGLRAFVFGCIGVACAACAGPATPAVADVASGFTLADTKVGPKDTDTAGSDATSEPAETAAETAPVADAASPPDAEPDTGALVDSASLDVADTAPDTKPDTKADAPDVKPDTPDTKPDVKDVKDTGPDVPPPPTFAEVWSQVIAAPTYGCAATKCHGTKPDTAGLDLFTSQASAYDKLINKPAKFKACSGEMLVVPNDPDASVLFTKVMPDTATCGAKMPEAVDSTGILETDAELIKAWILGGAKP